MVLRKQSHIYANAFLELYGCFEQTLKFAFNCHVYHRPQINPRPPDKSALPEHYFSYFSTKTYVVGTQKSRLDKTVL